MPSPKPIHKIKTTRLSASLSTHGNHVAVVHLRSRELAEDLPVWKKNGAAERDALLAALEAQFPGQVDMQEADSEQTTDREIVITIHPEQAETHIPLVIAVLDEFVEARKNKLAPKFEALKDIFSNPDLKNEQLGAALRQFRNPPRGRN